MIINNFDVGYPDLVFQLYRKEEHSQYNHECKLRIVLISDMGNENLLPQNVTIYGKEALTKLRDELIKYFPLDDFIPPSEVKVKPPLNDFTPPPVVEIKSPPTKIDITIKLPVKKYTFREFESPHRFDAFQITNCEDGEINFKWPEWLIKAYITTEPLNLDNVVYKSNPTKNNSILTVNLLTGQKYIYSDDWIVQSEDGHIFGFDSKDFTRLFKEVS